MFWPLKDKKCQAFKKQIEDAKKQQSFHCDLLNKQHIAKLNKGSEDKDKKDPPTSYKSCFEWVIQSIQLVKCMFWTAF